MRTRPAPSIPDVLPELRPGRHRRPEQGGCLMEWTSVLAGERWSDHPTCTHPLLAHLARSVNDLVEDGSRMRLTHLVPDLVGTASDDPAWSLEIADVAARHALPVARAQDARVLAVALITLDRLLEPVDGRASGKRRRTTDEALARVPVDAAWAERFTRAMGRPRRTRDLPRGVVDVSLAAVATGPRCDEDLVAMLVDAVSTCRAMLPSREDREGAGSATWRELAGARA
ncbi:hypothetical protein Cch01nite_42190 [Cellulomonas chitinilytica]|uniref:Uncharacterized protein n=1 Tax=Cellulomonas chitinilytica TaxID=398759 RepID=A0A919U108_9CELL|nr:hypothetical protein [Cellulomonas chitinilytica]GIG23495.1 hypothetical protein Cch01nite_42190 [Cellulomonas chitinilytica]